MVVDIGGFFAIGGYSLSEAIALLETTIIFIILTPQKWVRYPC